MCIKNKDLQNKIVNTIFYIALTIELIIMIVEKSDLSFSLESYVFRVTFVLSLLCVIIMTHSISEWVLLIMIWSFTFYCYKTTGNNDLLRIATFVMAARDIDLEKTMRYILIFTSFGFAIISFLSLLGILGSIYVIDDYGHGNPNELRYVLGFGHPNTLFSSIYSIFLLWVWNYGKKAKWWHFAIITLFMIIICFITSSRTSIIISLLTIVLTVIARFLPNIAKKDISYITAGFISPILCVIFSMYSAGISHIIPYLWEKDWRSILDSSLTNRIKDLYYSNDRHSGAIETWELFSNRTSTEYFDMGWVRMFYWYGIIPTTFIIIAIIFLLYLCSKEKDIWTTILVISLGTYTTIEATYVSSYIGRNFMLIILGAYIGKWLKGNCISNYHSE